MKGWIIIAVCLTYCTWMHCQTYNHATSGIALEYVGACEVATCGGNYYDNGDAAGNYSNNINDIYRVFCPNTAGQCLTATFSSFSIEGGAGCPYDYFVVSNGSTQNSPALWAGCGTGSIGPFTGTNNGCLGFRFYSDGSVTSSGWAATFSCAPCPGGPNGTANNDCINATPICANKAFPGNSTGPGIAAEACGGGGCPAGGENYSNWYRITVQTGGTFTFTILPQVASDDYDYAVYGPNTSCGSLGASIRCSDSELSGNTGLSSAAGDLTENVQGDKYTAQMNVNTGDTYYIMIDEWTPTGAGYNLNFGGTAVLGCTITPVVYSEISARYLFDTGSVRLDWTTLSELDNDYFVIERSFDGNEFEAIDWVEGAGTSHETHHYTSVDYRPLPGEVNYYRIRQIDFNGQESLSDIQAVLINDPGAGVRFYPNPAGGDQSVMEFVCPDEGRLITLGIYNSTGQSMHRQQLGSSKGVNRLSIDLTSFPVGIYFVNLTMEGEMIQGSFIRE
jgi:hypothetical protein